MAVAQFSLVQAGAQQPPGFSRAFSGGLLHNITSFMLSFVRSKGVEGAKREEITTYVKETVLQGRNGAWLASLVLLSFRPFAATYGIFCAIIRVKHPESLFSDF